jgi:hypothetical protein
MLEYEPDTLPADSIVHSAYQLKCTDLSVKQLHDVLVVYKRRIFFQLFAYVPFHFLLLNYGTHKAVCHQCSVSVSLLWQRCF